MLVAKGTANLANADSDLDEIEAFFISEYKKASIYKWESILGFLIFSGLLWYSAFLFKAQIFIILSTVQFTLILVFGYLYFHENKIELKAKEIVKAIEYYYDALDKAGLTDTKETTTTRETRRTLEGAEEMQRIIKGLGEYKPFISKEDIPYKPPVNADEVLQRIRAWKDFN